MAWFDTDVRFDDGGLGAELATALRRLEDLRDRRAGEVRRAGATWQGGARAAFDDADRRVRDELAALADVLRAASGALQTRGDAAARENRRRADLRRDRDERLAREAATNDRDGRFVA